MQLDHYKLLGSTGLRVSPLCLGTMTFGTEWGWGSDEAVSREIFERYAERGGNFIDTANYYTGGSSERLLGKFLKGRRQRFVVGTKYSLHMEPGNPNSGGNHRKNMMESVNASLERLDTDYIDLLWLHAWEFRTPVEEVMRAFDDLVRQGKVHYIAISDAPGWKVAQANTLAEQRGWTKFCAYQAHYNLIERTSELELLPMCRELGISLMPWSPLAGGVLSGKYTREHVTGDTDGVDAARTGMTKALGQLTDRAIDIAEVVKEVAAETGASPSQVSLRWLIDQPGVLAPIVGARKLSHLTDNLKALDIELSAEHHARLDSVSKPEPIFPGNFAASDAFRVAVDGETVIEGGFRA
ncbi:MAG: aldo/keto reductase [Acidobacteriota bacterium]|nr:aldo/keto reductase [Acidobacteriota bacterium]